jgi:BASS family bile acid:Na+ symporter
MWIRKAMPKLADASNRIAPFLGVVLVSLLCGGVVAQNATLFLQGSASGITKNLIARILISVLSLHTVGFTVGYLTPKKIFSLSETSSRTISIETGMQNSALAVVLAQSVVGAMAAPSAAMMSLACLPGALSATAHSCLGSALAVYWRWVDDRRRRRASNSKNDNDVPAVSGINGVNRVNEVDGSGI